MKRLEDDMRNSRISDFMNYFNNRGMQVPSNKPKFTGIPMLPEKPVFQLQTGHMQVQPQEQDFMQQ